MEKDKRWTEQVTFVICKTTMGSATSRLCASSTPTLALNDICQRMRCLVACCGSQVHIKDFKIGLRTTATVGRESGPGSSQTAHDH